jgi:quercetin 2,3-dioxygenase
MAHVRDIDRIFIAYETIEGAGVRLHRAIGYEEVPLFDPFLLFDDFRAKKPEDYLSGFPWHPHRGIETVTYMLEGIVAHGDSMGNAGTIGAGDIQWMTAGSGIIHQEMPKPVDGHMGGFQLWVNLPRANKMMKPRYQEIKSAQVPVISPQEQVSIRVICGNIGGTNGPVTGIIADPQYLDVTIGAETEYIHPVKKGYAAAAYVIGGAGTFDQKSDTKEKNRAMLLFSDGDEVHIRSSGEGLRFLFIAGKPIQEPVAWEGPIVMNSQDELREAFREYREGTFIRP